MPKKTDLPKRILTALRANPFLRRQELQAQLDVGYQAIQKTLGHLMHDDQLVREAFIVEPRALGDQRKFWIMITTSHPDPDAVARRGGGADDYQGVLCERIRAALRNREPGTEGVYLDDVHVIMGREFDVMLTVLSDGFDAVARFVTRRLRLMPAVSGTTTAWQVLPEKGEASARG